MVIRSVKSKEELLKAYKLVADVLKLAKTHPRDITYYTERYKESGKLIKMALEKNKLVGALFATPENNKQLLIGEIAVRSAFRGMGVGEKLFNSVEKTAKSMGFGKIVAGIRDGVEEFYIKCGYETKLFIQIPKKTEEIVKFNSFLETIPSEYTVERKESPDFIKIIIDAPTLGIEKSYQNNLRSIVPNGHTQILAFKYI